MGIKYMNGNSSILTFEIEVEKHMTGGSNFLEPWVMAGCRNAACFFLTVVVSVLDTQ